MTRYTVTAERTKHWWVLQAVEAPGAISQVKRLDRADVVKEAISIVTGEPEDQIEIDLRPVGHRYVVRAKRWAEGWELYIDGLGVTQSRTLATAERQVRDYLETLGIDASTARMNLKYDLPVKYRIEVSQEDESWLVDVTNLPGAHTYGRTLDEALTNTAEVIRLVEDEGATG